MHIFFWNEGVIKMATYATTWLYSLLVELQWTVFVHLNQKTARYSDNGGRMATVIEVHTQYLQWIQYNSGM